LRVATAEEQAAVRAAAWLPEAAERAAALLPEAAERAAEWIVTRLHHLPMTRPQGGPAAVRQSSLASKNKHPTGQSQAE